jgi:hypothetical protein
MRSTAPRTVLLVAVAGVMAACGGTQLEAPAGYDVEQNEKLYQHYGTIHGNPNGFVFGGDDDDDEGDNGSVTGRVNAYLWRAALETMDFMPLAQTDSVGGVIITEWYAPPETQGERFKVTVYILDKELRADGVRVAVFRQKGNQGRWIDTAVDPATESGLEDSILARARELRLASLEAAES